MRSQPIACVQWLEKNTTVSNYWEELVLVHRWNTLYPIFYEGQGVQKSSENNQALLIWGDKIIQYAPFANKYNALNAAHKKIQLYILLQ